MDNMIYDGMSENIFQSFKSLTYSINELEYAAIYRKIYEVLPKESISFSNFNIEELIGCEVICAAICNKINWDFLRKVVFSRTLENPSWLIPDNLVSLKPHDIYVMLSEYEKKERIMPKERCEMLVEIGRCLKKGPKTFKNIFFKDETAINTYEDIVDFFNSVNVFSSDPQQKKLQLLLQSLSDYPQFSILSHYYKPTIDYHLIRLFLRRGIVKPITQAAMEYVFNQESIRRESTVASLRQVCSESLETLCWITSLDVRTVNRIEWWIGRTTCINGVPDCYLEKSESSWLKKCFDKCPYYNYCYARQVNNKFLDISEPRYHGNSY